MLQKYIRWTEENEVTIWNNVDLELVWWLCFHRQDQKVCVAFNLATELCEKHPAVVEALMKPKYAAMV